MFLSLLDTQPPDFFHDPFGQFLINVVVALVVGLASVFIAIWIFRKQRIRKEISYTVISDAPIASINEAVTDKVGLYINGKPVKNARLLILKVWNSGNVAVRPEDYSEPIIFEFGERVVVDFDILDTELINLQDIKTFLEPVRMKPENLQSPVLDTKMVSTSKAKSNGMSLIQNIFQSIIHHRQDFPDIQPNGIKLMRFLLNPKESITLKVMLQGSESKVIGNARIIDGLIIEQSNNIGGTDIWWLKLSNYLWLNLRYFWIILIFTIVTSGVASWLYIYQGTDFKQLPIEGLFEWFYKNLFSVLLFAISLLLLSFLIYLGSRLYNSSLVSSLKK